MNELFNSAPSFLD